MMVLERHAFSQARPLSALAASATAVAELAGLRLPRRPCCLPPPEQLLPSPTLAYGEGHGFHYVGKS